MEREKGDTSMMRSSTLGFVTGCAALFTTTIPQNVLAQYAQYLTMPQPTPYAQPPNGPYRPGPIMQDLEGTWFMSGDEDRPCQIIPSRRGDRAMFINENGGRAEGFMRGNRIIVPRWDNLQGRFLGDTIRWSNNSVWTR
jgi:hypothetical protein